MQSIWPTAFRSADTDEAAAKFGNNPNQARDTYIDPAIWELLKG